MYFYCLYDHFVCIIILIAEILKIQYNLYAGPLHEEEYMVDIEYLN